MKRIKLDALPVPLAAWIVWTLDEKDEDVLAHYQYLTGSQPARLVEYSNQLWAGPIPEEL